MVLIAVCAVPFRIELQLENYVLELGLGGAFPIDNQVEHMFPRPGSGEPFNRKTIWKAMALKLCLGVPIPMEGLSENVALDAWLGGAPCNRQPMGK